MIYAILKVLCRITVWSYFRRIQIDGKDKIPLKGPFIFVANHPSAFMDPIIIASHVRPQIYFIAAGEYVGKGIKGWFLKTFFHMIPVYRPTTRPEETHKNADMFRNCFKHLASRSSLLVFPEGVSKTELKIKPLKTGTARIARGAELEQEMKLGLTIIPIGLNYSNPHQFRSDLYVKIGNPIVVKDFISSDDSAEVTEVQELTAEIEKRIKQCVLHVDTEENESILRKIEAIYSRNLKDELDIEFSDQKREFQVQKEIIQALNYFETYQKSEFESFRNQLNDFFDDLQNLGLHHRGLRSNSRTLQTARTIQMILGFPFFLAGSVLNFVPYMMVELLNRRLKVNETFQGSMILASGLVIYLLWYSTLNITACCLLTPFWWGFAIVPLAYTLGLYASIYLSALQYSRERKNVKQSRVHDQSTINKLLRSQNDLIDRLEQYKTIYLEEKEKITQK
ncbi:MAG: lysophospholipid acyltransferase family protein [Flavobacteriales bacterium]|nr:lysophospholipid acyltransferase family protein [Flavobacteriales bacterium]